MSRFLKEIASSFIGWAFSLAPQPQPSDESLDSSKVVAHRGGLREGVKENTLQAFAFCEKCSVWGIEFDIRWTKDNEPIVLHDEGAGRVFGKPYIRPRDFEYKDLKSQVPEIPHFKDVVEKYSRKLHLMIELKEDLTDERRVRLTQILNGLKPVEDFHLLSLVPARLKILEKNYSKECFVGVSTTNSKTISKKVLELSYGGHAGHFWLLNRKIQELHQRSGQKVGTGFADSKSLFYREIHRGVDWIFTNSPEKIMRIVNAGSPQIP